MMRVTALGVVAALLVAGCGSAVTSEGYAPSSSPAAVSESANALSAEEESSGSPTSSQSSSSAPADPPPSDAFDVADRLGCEEVESVEPGPGDDPAPSSLVSCLLAGDTFTVATYRSLVEVSQVIDQLDDLMVSLTLSGVVGSGDNWVVFSVPDIELTTVMQEKVEESGGTLTAVGS